MATSCTTTEIVRWLAHLGRLYAERHDLCQLELRLCRLFYLGREARRKAAMLAPTARAAAATFTAVPTFVSQFLDQRRATSSFAVSAAIPLWLSPMTKAFPALESGHR
mmetsp:Transcript_24100/g.33853  ORF Transcript_24100/g.33853 Transcript_24100/m.33853 type:complete len:108 (-) Transcript_24100:417-740(-)